MFNEEEYNNLNCVLNQELKSITKYRPSEISEPINSAINNIFSAEKLNLETIYDALDRLIINPIVERLNENHFNFLLDMRTRFQLGIQYREVFISYLNSDEFSAQNQLKTYQEDLSPHYFAFFLIAAYHAIVSRQKANLQSLIQINQKILNNFFFPKLFQLRYSIFDQSLQARNQIMNKIRNKNRIELEEIEILTDLYSNVSKDPLDQNAFSYFLEVYHKNIEQQRKALVSIRTRSGPRY